jgi:hypothetical protein
MTRRLSTFLPLSALLAGLLSLATAPEAHATCGTVTGESRESVERCRQQEGAIQDLELRQQLRNQQRRNQDDMQRTLDGLSQAQRDQELARIRGLLEQEIRRREVCSQPPMTGIAGILAAPERGALGCPR